MKKNNNRRRQKPKPRRNKKYAGSKKQLDESLPNSYDSAINFLSPYNKGLTSFASQLSSISDYSNNSLLNFQPAIGIANNFTDLFPAFNNIQAVLPTINHLSEISPILDASRQAILSASSLSNSFSTSREIVSTMGYANIWNTQNITRSLQHSLSSVRDLHEISNSLNSIMGQTDFTTFALQSSIYKATELSLFAEKSLYSVTPSNIGNKLVLDSKSKNYLTSSFLDFSNGYADLLKTFESNPTLYTQFDPSLTTTSATEFFSGANLLEVISVEEETTKEEEEVKQKIQYENEVSLSTHLPIINDGLYNMWKGAIEAYHSSNSDKVRHFSTSIRELFTHIIHILAPDKDIKSWSSDPNLYDTAGRPKRQARLLYICRNISDDTFKTFVKKDVDATLAFIDIFQKGTHAIDPKFTPHNLIAIKSKAETTLKFLIEIELHTNR